MDDCSIGVGAAAGAMVVNAGEAAMHAAAAAGVAARDAGKVKAVDTSNALGDDFANVGTMGDRDAGAGIMSF